MTCLYWLELQLPGFADQIVTKAVVWLLMHQLTRVDATELDKEELRAACRDLLATALA